MKNNIFLFSKIHYYSLKNIIIFLLLFFFNFATTGTHFFHHLFHKHSNSSTCHCCHSHEHHSDLDLDHNRCKAPDISNQEKKCPICSFLYLLNKSVTQNYLFHKQYLFFSADIKIPIDSSPKFQLLFYPVGSRAPPSTY